MIKNIDSMGYTQADNFNDRPTQTIRPTSLQIQKNWLNLDTHLNIHNYAGLHRDDMETIEVFELTVLELYL